MDRLVHICGPNGPFGAFEVVPFGVDMASTTAAQPLRADARRNLERILEAAREAFAEGGLDVGVEEIARRAGVGKATFFRRFPSKEALLVAIFEGFVADVEQAADDALTAGGEPIAPLRAFLRHSLESQGQNKAFFDAVAARFIPPVELIDRVMEAIARVMAPAQEAGVLRPGVEPGDVSTATKMLGAAIRPMEGMLLPEAAWDRYLDVVLRGLTGDAPLPGLAADPCTMAREMSATSA
jgi:AcrR family transcriptional regulator